jgi:UDP-N-acetylglucosamine:LPS N-acetylglucosamine transferase
MRAQTSLPLVVGVDMGYGHLRAAWPLAEALGVAVSRADEPPHANPSELRVWAGTRKVYEQLSRLSQQPPVGAPFRYLLDRVTTIQALDSSDDLSRPDLAARLLGWCIDRGFGAGLYRHLESGETSLVSTFYAPAIAADGGSSRPVFCVVTDSDVHRVWVPRDGGRSRIHYFVPTPATAERLLSYGVHKDKIECTGFPLPLTLEANADTALTHRLRRLQGEGDAPPLLTVAIGGAGAQAGRVRTLLRSLASPLNSGVLRLALVPGLRKGLARRFRRWAMAELGNNGDSVEVVSAENFDELYRRFNDLLASTDALWTKPSELSFYAALGLPLIVDDPVGAHERANARWLFEAGAAVGRPMPAALADAIPSWLSDGTLARCARRGFDRLPRGATTTIAARVLNSS